MNEQQAIEDKVIVLASTEQAVAEAQPFAPPADREAIGPDHEDSEATLTSQKLIFDIALKKVDSLDRYFDTLNIRAGAIFGFVGFVLPNALNASKEIGGYCTLLGHKYYWPGNWVSKLLAMTEFVSFLIVTVFCYLAYRIESDKLFPPLRLLYKDRVRDLEWKTRELLIGHIDDMCQCKHELITKKSIYIRWAMIILVAEIILISIAFCVARVCA